jgi:WD40 repeat protein
MKKFLFLFLFLFFSLVAFSQSYKQGDKVLISWKGQWYPGQIIQVTGDKYLISYDGYDASWNETVGTDRLKKADANTGQVTINPQTTSETKITTDVSFKSVESIPGIDQSSDGKLIFAASAYGNIRILNANDLSLVSQITVGKNPLQDISVTADGNFLAVAATDKLIVYSKNESGTYVEYFSSDVYASISKLSFSPTSHELIVGGAPKEDYKKTQVDVWNMDAKKIKQNLIKSTNSDYSISGLSISADGNKIAVAISNKNHGIDVFDAVTGKLAYHIAHTTDVVACAFSPDGNSIVSGGIDKKITLWNLSTKKAIWSSVWKTGDQYYVYGVAFSADGKTVCACGSGTGSAVKIYDAATGAVKKELGSSNPGGNDLFFSKDGSAVFIAFTTYGDIAQVPVVERFVI